MIGQKRLQSTLDNLIQNNAFPRFVLLTGPKGSGKKLLADALSKKIAQLQFTTNDVSIASVRQIIDESYKQRESCCYIIQDVDGMSTAAKNALLKVTEEPPNNAYLIMTIEDANYTLETIRSRATTFMMGQYSRQEITEFYDRAYPHGNEQEKKLVVDVCETPGEVIQFVDQRPVEFMNYVKLVADNITEVSGANAFKIANKVALGKDDEGYDLKLFWKLFIASSFKDARAMSGSLRTMYLRRTQITSVSITDLRIKGINKNMLMDKWILDIRQEVPNGPK